MKAAVHPPIPHLKALQSKLNRQSVISYRKIKIEGRPGSHGACVPSPGQWDDGRWPFQADRIWGGQSLLSPSPSPVPGTSGMRRVINRQTGPLRITGEAQKTSESFPYPPLTLEWPTKAIIKARRWLWSQTSLSRSDLLGSKGLRPLPHSQKAQENTLGILMPQLRNFPWLPSALLLCQICAP